MKRYLLPLFLLCLAACHKTAPGKLRVETGDVSDITDGAATLTGTVWPTADLADVMVGFLCSTDSYPDIENSRKIRVRDWTPGEKYVYRLDDLVPGTTYYYKAYVQYNGLVHQFGDVKSFTTSGTTVNIRTGETSDVTEMSAVLTGTAWPSWDMQDAYVCFQWSTDGQFLLGYTREARVYDWKSGEAFSLQVNDLSPATTYYYRACLQHDGQNREFGDIKTFTTSEITAYFVLNDAEVTGRYSATVSGEIHDTEKYAGKVYQPWLTVSADPSFAIGASSKSIEISFSGDGRFQVPVDQLTAGTRYYYRVGVQILTQRVFSETKSFETLDYQYVPGDAIDLGLSVLWNTWNLGASAPEDVGAYFSWGETSPKHTFVASNYQGEQGDAAAVLWGDGWRMPSSTECAELKKACTWSFEAINGIPCYRGTPTDPEKAGQTILFPATGYFCESGLLDPTTRYDYWTSTVAPGRSGQATGYSYVMSFGSYGGPYIHWQGLPIRPVRDK